MPWTQIAQKLFEEGVPSGSRSTVVTALGYFGAALAACMLGSVEVGAPEWMQILLASFFGIDFLTFIVLYIFFALTDKDSLRSEKFFIQKMAIEHRLYGDSDMGLVDVTTPGNEGGTAIVVANARTTPTSKSS
jgi:hypothetical protein